MNIGNGKWCIDLCNIAFMATISHGALEFGDSLWLGVRERRFRDLNIKLVNCCILSSKSVHVDSCTGFPRKIDLGMLPALYESVQLAYHEAKQSQI
jgi:hypothetical protein